MSADKVPTQRVAGIVVGQSPLRVWGLTSEARLQRQFARAGMAATPADADRVVLLRADWVFDEALVRGLAGATDDVALRAGEGDGEVVALSVAAAQAAEAATRLAERQALAGARTVSPAQIADGYNDKLRKREPPYLLPLTAESMDAIEWRTFRGAYKGVTDLVTLYAWPRPARYVTRLCAEAGITPNQVTSLSLVLVLAAMWLFWTGHYGWGLAAAWGMTFLDTVDGKLARVTLNSSRFGDFFDHSIDLVHPPFWWWAWIVGLAAVGLPLTHAALALTAIVAGYVLQRLEEGLFIACFGIEMHVWERFDSRFRLITARRNPNLLLLTASLPFGRPDLGILAVAIWTVACLAVHAVRLLQAAVARRRGPLRSWLSAST
ncbi:CDP-alcohol phosphatidyltransferase family protein [Acidovorax sp. T1]|uniref:CDP-alcohol phosphatidyltransferase family protein n=2 Tax=unclassified Acidovorax TaxID=2684926 RepID=UPI000B3F7148|nr:CDP-alcohol phosphatidyltransferase family protein [Acidovorax sp. T1]